MTSSVPALLILLAAVASAALLRSFLAGAMTGLIAFAVGYLALFVVLAVEGPVWMQERGVFPLDGDPPRGVVGTVDIAMNLFSSGMWVGHLVPWILAAVAGAAIGAGLGTANAHRGIVGS